MANEFPLFFSWNPSFTFFGEINLNTLNIFQ